MTCYTDRKTTDNVVEAASHGELCTSPPLNQQLSKFSQEVVDLLQHSPRCCLPFSRFVPTYHHHFGRQCRIANYGFTKVIELFDAIPHIVQVLSTQLYWYNLSLSSCYYRVPQIKRCHFIFAMSLFLQSLFCRPILSFFCAVTMYLWKTC